MFRLTTFEFALQHFSPAVCCTTALGSAAAIGRAALFPSVLLAEQHNLGGERRARSGL